MQKLAAYISTFPVKKFEKNQLIVCQGDAPTTVYAIKSGFVKGYDINDQGMEQLLWFGSRMDIFPLGYMFGQIEESQFFYSAFSDVEAYAMKPDDLIQYLSNNPTPLMELTRRLTSTFYDSLHRLNAAERPKASDKIAHTLYFIANRFKKNSPPGVAEISLPLTHQDIANLLGLTRETAAVELKKLKDAKLIYYDKWHFTVFTDKMKDHLSID